MTHESHHDDHTGHHDHHRMMIRDFRRRLYVTLVLTLPVLALSPLIEKLLGFSFGFPGSSYVVFGLATIIFFYGGAVTFGLDGTPFYGSWPPRLPSCSPDTG